MKFIHFSAITLVLLMGLLSVSAQSASAQPTAFPEWTCETYPGTVDEAIAYFDTTGGSATLDADGDGIACNEGQDTEGPSAWPEWTCDTFPGSVDEAVAYFDSYGGPATLDADGDGTACNEGSDDLADQVGAFPEWSCYTFPDGWDAAIAYYNTQGGPASLDADGDGIPCEANGEDDVVECFDLNGSQEEAQAYYDDHGQPRNLDLDQDGRACTNEDDGYFGPVGEPSSEAQEDSGTDEPSSEAQEDSGTDEPSAADQEDPGADEPTAAVKLPSTGAGIQIQDSQTSPHMFAVLSILIVIALTFTLRAGRR